VLLCYFCYVLCEVVYVFEVGVYLYCGDDGV